MGRLSDMSDYVVQMDVVDPDVCWRLIARTRFGRVGFVIDASPVCCR